MMKAFSLIPASLAVLALLAGCSQEDRTRASSTVQDAYQDAKAAISEAWSDAKDYTFEKKNEFSAAARSMGSRMESEISELRANYSEAKASASRKAAMDELRNSEADYKQKLEALGNATADTWDSAKQNVIAAWDRLQAAYDKARAD